MTFPDPPCAQVYQKGLETAPDNLQLLSSLAQFHATQRNFKEAEALWQRVLALDPSNGHALYALGLQYQQSGEFVAARAAFKRGLGCKGAGLLAEFKGALKCRLYASSH